MAELPFLHITVPDDLAATAHLTEAAFGIYESLRYHYWLRQGPLPIDEEALIRLGRTKLSTWRKVAPAVLAFFVQTPEGYRNDALERGIARALQRSEMARDSINKRWDTGRGSIRSKIRTNDAGSSDEQSGEVRSSYSPASAAPPPVGGGAEESPGPLVENLGEFLAGSFTCKHCGTVARFSQSRRPFCPNSKCPGLTKKHLRPEFIPSKPAQGDPQYG